MRTTRDNNECARLEVQQDVWPRAVRPVTSLKPLNLNREYIPLKNCSPYVIQPGRGRRHLAGVQHHMICELRLIPDLRFLILRDPADGKCHKDKWLREDDFQESWSHCALGHESGAVCAPGRTGMELCAGSGVPTPLRDVPGWSSMPSRFPRRLGPIGRHSVRGPLSSQPTRERRL